MDKNTTFKYWLAVARHTSYKIGKQPRPAFVGQKQVPDNLNQLSIGQLIDLSQLSDSEESLYQIVTTVLGLSHKEVEQARAVDVVMLIGWVTAEVERINKLFESTDTAKPTRLEKEAGIDTLRFGLFGMLDWYAVRMGIKGRVGFEAAAPMLIIGAHRFLEKYTLSKWQQHGGSLAVPGYVKAQTLRQCPDR